MIAYHVVTDRPMHPGQRLQFDENHCSGVYRRVQEKKEAVEAVYAAPEQYEGFTLEHHLAVAFRELAMEEVRQEKYPPYPSRLRCLYASGTLEEAERWAAFFAEIGRPTYSIVKIQVNGHSFCGNAERCFDGSADRCSNRRLAEQYWENPYDGSGICEMLVDGEIEVVEIVKEINANLPEDAE